MTDKVQKIKEWISKTQDDIMDANGNFEYPEHEGAYHILCNLDAYIDSLQEEPVNEDLEEACEQLAENARKHKAETLSPFFSQTDYKRGVIDGAQWQKQQMMKDAVEGSVKEAYAERLVIESRYLYKDEIEELDIRRGDKVKLIIIKED